MQITYYAPSARIEIAYHRANDASLLIEDRGLLVEPSRPEVDAKPALEFRDGGQVRPGAPAEDRKYRRVVDPDVLGSGADAAVAYGSLDVQGELPGDLTDGIYRRHVGPVLREVSWDGSSWPGHMSSVDDARVRS